MPVSRNVRRTPSFARTFSMDLKSPFSLLQPILQPLTPNASPRKRGEGSRSWERLLFLTMVLGITLGPWAQSISAEESPANAGADPSGVATANQPASVDTRGGDDKVIREQSIYIPYEKLRKVFEKEGRGVFLPYEKFRELWQAAREKTEPSAEPEPPVGALITEVDNEATAEKDVVRVKAAVKIEILAKGWNEIPLRLADAAITKATLGDQPARIVANGDAGYKLLVHKEGDASQQIVLALEYAS